MSRGFTKARMILVTKVLIANQSFLKKFVSNWGRSVQYTRIERNSSSIRGNLIQIFTSIINNFDTTISPLEFVSILYSFILRYARPERNCGYEIPLG